MAISKRNTQIVLLVIATAVVSSVMLVERFMRGDSSRETDETIVYAPGIMDPEAIEQRRAALEVLRKRAEGGDVEAMLDVAMAEFSGVPGVIDEPDRSAALEKLKTAALAGSNIASNNVGAILMGSSGHADMPFDAEEAIKWYRLSAERGDTEGMRNLGYFLAYDIKDPAVNPALTNNMERRQEGLDWLNRAVALGDTSSLLIIERIAKDGQQ